MILHYLCRSPVSRYNTPKNLHLEQTLLWFHLELHVNQNTWWLLQKMTEFCCLEMSWKICLKIVQTCSIAGGNLVLLQVANLFYYRGNIVLPQGKLVFLQGATLFYYRGQTCFTAGVKLAKVLGGRELTQTSINPSTWFCLIFSWPWTSYLSKGMPPKGTSW